ncbi:MAG: PepSY domain-containing protein [Hyphomicrobium sp.]|nr:PepSY domain-containing protein [Hyphomicrobium sp.]
MSAGADLYRTVWRWHFYAGLFVIPFIAVLATTGAIYLFKPQVERWEERAFQRLPVDGALSADTQLKAVLEAFPDSKLLSYRLPERAGDAVAMVVTRPVSAAVETLHVFVSPQGQVLGSLAPESRTMAVVARIHGQLLLGPQGSWLVELAASWAIVMILSGLYLWWPRDRRLAGVLWPRLKRGGRVFWRDLHAVAGFWVSLFTLCLLVTGLPWAAVWGSAFRTVRAEMGWMKGLQQWTIGGAPAAVDNDASHASHGVAQPARSENARGDDLQAMVSIATRKGLAFPVVIIPPGAPQRFAAPVAAWTIKSDAQNRPLQSTILYDPTTLQQLSREDFADRHPIDRVIGYGVAWHEGQLFGWVNQLIGVFTAISLIALAVTGFVMWRQRKPESSLGAPSRTQRPIDARPFVLILLLLALVLPMLAISLVLVATLDRVIVRRNARIANWLGA